MASTYALENLDSWFSGLKTFADPERRFGAMIPQYGGSILPHVHFYVLAALHDFGCSSFVETGTNAGKTISVVAQGYRGPIYSCEIEPRLAELSRTNLAPFEFPQGQVELRTCSSVEMIADLMHGGRLGNRPFFFLDAHGENGPWPLTAELELISTLPEWVVAIHDFPQPGHHEHPAEAMQHLNSEQVNEGLRKLDPGEWFYWFPRLPAMEDLQRNLRIGSVFLARGVDADVAKALNRRMTPVMQRHSRLNGRLVAVPAFFRTE